MSEEKKPKDFWDKVDIVLRPVNGLLTAVAVGLLGYYTSGLVRQQETRDSNERVYTQLVSSREQADSNLRKDMFLSIVQVFLKPSASTIEDRMLNIEMLAYNFNDSLNLKPLFVSLQREIPEQPEPARTGYTKRLNRIGQEISTRQLLLLSQVGKRFDRSVDFEKLKENPGGIELEAGKASLQQGAPEREFTLSVQSVDLDRRELTLEMVVRSTEAKGDDSSQMQHLTFHVGYFDFPTIDNTRLSHDERAAVVLNQFGAGGADISLVYFPGSYASLKEKVSYDEVVEQLRGFATNQK